MDLQPQVRSSSPQVTETEELIPPISAPAFGAAPSTGLFGQPQQQQQQQPQQTGSTVAPYSATPKQDGNNSITLHSITSMPQYEAKSFEELRLEDYLNNNKGTKGQNPPATGFGGFGAPGKSAAIYCTPITGLGPQHLQPLHSDSPHLPQRVAVSSEALQVRRSTTPFCHLHVLVDLFSRSTCIWTTCSCPEWGSLRKRSW